MHAELAEKIKIRCEAIAAFARWWFVVAIAATATLLPAASGAGREPSSDAASRETQADAIRRLPMRQLSREAQQLVNDVIDRPSFFRRMPTQTIDCDPELFRFVVRYPEVLVNIWDVMGITKVEIKRTGPFTFTADDSVGTVCKCDLIYGNDQLHIYYGTGAYKGSMTPRQVTGRCVCILHSTNGQKSDGSPIVTGTMDVFLKLDNLGADLLTRTLGPFVGKTADYNFIESAKFISQISEVCEHNPEGAEQLISKLQKVNPEVRDEFSRIAAKVGSASWQRIEARELATLGPTRTEPPSATVPVAEFQSRSASTLPAELQEQVQLQNTQLQAGSSRLQAAKLASPAEAALHLTLSDSDDDAQFARPMAETVRPRPEPAASVPGRPTVLVPIAPALNGMDRSIAPAKPGVYMRR